MPSGRNPHHNSVLQLMSESIPDDGLLRGGGAKRRDIEPEETARLQYGKNTRTGVLPALPPRAHLYRCVLVSCSQHCVLSVPPGNNRLWCE